MSPKVCVTWQANQSNASPNASQWNMVMLGNIRVGFVLGMSMSCCLSPFPPALLPNVNAVSGGIRA